MQPSSSRSVYKKVFIGIIILLVLLGVAAAAYLMLPEKSESSATEAAAISQADGFVQQINSNDHEATYDQLAEGIFTPTDWYLWVDSINQLGVEIDTITDIKTIDESAENPSYQVTYSTNKDNNLTFTVQQAGSEWIISDVRMVAV